MTIDQEIALRELRVDPWRVRREFDIYFRRAVREGMIHENCPTASYLYRIVHAAITMAEDGLIP